MSLELGDPAVFYKIQRLTTFIYKPFMDVFNAMLAIPKTPAQWRLSPDVHEALCECFEADGITTIYGVPVVIDETLEENTVSLDSEDYMKR